MLFGTLARQVKKLARRLARKNENLARFWHVATQARWDVNHTGTQARCHADHVATQARIARNLANSYKSSHCYMFCIKGVLGS